MLDNWRLTSNPELIDVCIEFQNKVGYLTQGRALHDTLQRLKQLPIEILAIQHGEMLQGQRVIYRLFKRLDDEFG